MTRPGEPAVIVRSHMLSAVEVSYPLGMWLPMTILIDICDIRHIRPPDTLRVDLRRPGCLDLAITRDSYVCTVQVLDDTDTLDAPIFRSGCHALLDAYESRAQGEPTVSVVLESARGKK